KVISYSLRVEPAKHFINWQQDPFANFQARLVFPEKATEFKVTVDLVVEMAVYNPFDFFLEPGAYRFPFVYEPRLAQTLTPRLGLAARFVSGYLIQLKADVKSLDGPSGTEVDFTDLHAWCEVYLPGAGWVGLDPTSGLMAGEGHIPLACTPQPSGAAPIEGMVDEAEVEFAHHMQVTRIYESPRVTKPYADEQWQEVLALGDAVDRDLAAGDVRLTMGGEPTFVATTN